MKRTDIRNILAEEGLSEDVLDGFMEWLEDNTYIIGALNEDILRILARKHKTDLSAPRHECGRYGFGFESTDYCAVCVRADMAFSAKEHQKDTHRTPGKPNPAELFLRILRQFLFSPDMGLGGLYGKLRKERLERFKKFYGLN